MTRLTPRTAAVLGLAAALALAGCGKKAPKELPPAPSASTSATPPEAIPVRRFRGARPISWPS